MERGLCFVSFVIPYLLFAVYIWHDGGKIEMRCRWDRHKSVDRRHLHIVWLAGWKGHIERASTEQRHSTDMIGGLCRTKLNPKLAVSLFLVIIHVISWGVACCGQVGRWS